jgi:uncharacterized protein (TIGR03437 family)
MKKISTEKDQKKLPTRRETLRLMTAAGMTAFLGWGGDKKAMQTGIDAAARGAGWPGVLTPSLFSASPVRMTRAVETLACVTRPALTEGPYFVEEGLNRSDIRSDPSTNVVRPGVPLKLNFSVNSVSGGACAPLSGAQVDVWHCDALGSYSDVAAGMGNGNTQGQKFLRGYQITDSNGAASFTTIYPGYYTGRTVHIHFKIRLFSGSIETYEFTSQFFFDDTLSDQVFTLAPYNTKSARTTRNNNDGIYTSQILISFTPEGDGYTGTLDIGLSGVPNAVTTVAAASAASFSTAGLAPESIAVLFGAGLAGTTLTATSTALPTTLGGVSVRLTDAAGTERIAPLYFVSPQQINFQVPAGTVAGAAQIAVIRDSATVAQGTATVQTVAPGMFTADATGQGVPAAVLLRRKADGSESFALIAQYNATTNVHDPIPIDLGDSTDQLFLIGFGSGFRNRSALSAVSATLGGLGAVVSYAGPQGNLTGLDQLNIAIPRTLSGRGNVELTVMVDGSTANTTTINIK